VSYENLEKDIVRVLRKYWTKRVYKDPFGKERTAMPRVISLDMETAPLKDMDFLTNERILAIAIARRISGRFGTSKGIEVKSLILKGNSDREEYLLLREFNELLKPEPLAVIGHGIRDYDLPLLSIKMKRYDPDVEEVKLQIPKIEVEKLWHIINILQRAVPLDLMIRLRHKLKTGKFDDIVENPKYSLLPLKRVKHPAPRKGETAGETILRTWKEDPEGLKKLVEAHVHDILLIAEHEFFVSNIGNLQDKESGEI